MINRHKTLELLKYINTPMSKESIGVIYNSNNIKFERCELFLEFVQSLTILVFDTYLGDDITDEDQRVNHFKWCWNKNVENFSKEGISIGNSKLFNYFMEFMLEHFYSIPNKLESDVMFRNIMKLWGFIFDITSNLSKSKSDIDTFIEIYKLFEGALK